MLDEACFRLKASSSIHRYPQHFERTIQFSRTERKLLSVVGGQDIRLSARECQPKVCFFFDSIRAHAQKRRAQIFSPTCPKRRRGIARRPPRESGGKTREWVMKRAALTDSLGSCHINRGAPLNQCRGEGPILSLKSPRRPPWLPGTEPPRMSDR